MERKHYNLVGVYCGSLYSIDMYDGKPMCIIEEPAVIIDPQCDIIHKWGNAGALEPVLVRYQEGMDKVNDLFPDEKPEIGYLISLSSLPVEKQAYVICRMVEYTASGFVAKFYDKINQPTAGIWLEAEIQRIPIDVTIGL